MAQVCLACVQHMYTVTELCRAGSSPIQDSYTFFSLDWKAHALSQSMQLIHVPLYLN